MSVITGVEPKKVFEFFEEIAAIPHGSQNTGAISDHLKDFALSRGLECIQDENDNLIIRKPGTAGYEASPGVCLQGHIDMVCEKEEGLDFDFESQGLKLKFEDGIISADGTTLGGDDGIAVAFCMAILDSDDIPHPPLEVVFTSDEEIGMIGASKLNMSQLSSRILINIDSEDEGILITGCAGGSTTKAVIPVKRKFKAGIGLELKVEGLMGGHSGTEIDKGRANADKLLGRILYHASKEVEFNIISLSGGLKDNAIPRSATALISAGGDMEAKKLKALTDIFSQIIAREYSITDPDIKISLKEAAAEEGLLPMDEESTHRVIAALFSFPNGIRKMSFDIKDLVETSLNLGIMNTFEDRVEFSFSVRSSVESEKEELNDQLECLTTALGGSLDIKGVYPAWEYRKDSPLRELVVKVYEEQYGKSPEVTAIHAGLECGIFAGALEGLDAISLGPDIKDIHTISEAMDVKSVKRVWDHLLEVLKRLK